MSIDKITIGFLSLVGSKCLSTFFILKILLNTILGANFFCAHPIVTSGHGCVGLVSKKLCTLRSNRVLELRSNSSRKMRKTWYGSGLRGIRKNLNSHRSVEKSEKLHECPKQTWLDWIFPVVIHRIATNAWNLFLTRKRALWQNGGCYSWLKL